MANDYLPTSDIDLQLWASRFVTYLTANAGHFGLTPADIAGIVAVVPEFSQARADADAARTTAKGLTSVKNGVRADMIAQVRAMVNWLQGNPATTNQDRDELGIPRRGETPPVLTEFDASIDRPSAVVDIRQILKHTIRVENENSMGTSKGKPAGAKGVEIWVKVGDEPASISDMRYVGLRTRNPIVVEFAPEDGNKQAHYKMRWVYDNGTEGNWSDLESATVAA